jgi:hypothetical protein
MAVYFSSFYPLCCTKIGKESVSQFHLPPFIDGSCRREPDFENKYPCITGLCRPGFSKKLEEGDIIIYSTNKRGIGSKKIVAILEVIFLRPDHRSAAIWYLKRKLDLPQNLIIKGSEPYPLEMTHRLGPWTSWVNSKGTVTEWDADYKDRAKNHPDVAICKIWNKEINLKTPRTITSREMIKIFGRIPGTRNPPELKDSEWEKFKRFILRPN